jgi:hypothetical protein
MSWDAAVRDYMLEVEGRRSKRTATLYRAALGEFKAANRIEYLNEITRIHLLALGRATTQPQVTRKPIRQLQGVGMTKPCELQLKRG